jgi:hypothetical protein
VLPESGLIGGDGLAWPAEPELDRRLFSAIFLSFIYTEAGNRAPKRRRPAVVISSQFGHLDEIRPPGGPPKMLIRTLIFPFPA